MSRLHVKWFFDSPGGTAVDASPLIPIFHEWIRRGALEGVLIDVADYRHVPDGPGVMLVAHDAFYSFDSTDGRPGLLLAERRPREGALGDRVADASRRLRRAVEALRAEQKFAAAPRRDGEVAAIRLVDRAPENVAAFERAEEEMLDALGALEFAGELQLTREARPQGELAGWTVSQTP